VPETDLRQSTDTLCRGGGSAGISRVGTSSGSRWTAEGNPRLCAWSAVHRSHCNVSVTLAHIIVLVLCQVLPVEELGELGYVT
jgi:hypothetical protein